MIREMYAEIQKQTDKHSVSELCEIYGVSRSGYYKYVKQFEPPVRELGRFISASSCACA